MNCKPGDLARFVAHCANRDVLVWVLDDVDCSPGDWRCESLQPVKAFRGDHCVGTYPAGTIAWVADADLRPIRDPGDDAIDETLLRLPAPSTERETA